MTADQHIENNCYVEYACPLCKGEVTFEEEWDQATDYDCPGCGETMVSRERHLCEERKQ